MDHTYTEAYPTIYAKHWWWRARESIVLDQISRVLPERGRRASILDVGCGAGLMFDVLQRFGEVAGIEADLASVQRSGRWRSNIHHGELNAAFRPSERFDLILLLDVIEHVDDPSTLLLEAGRRLSDDGHLLVTVPAFEWLWTRHDDVNHHRRRYTACQLRQALVAAGMPDVQTRYFFQSLILPKLLVRAKEIAISSSDEVPVIPLGPINGFLESWYRRENAVAGRLPFGTSVMAVAKRPCGLE